MQEHRKTDTPDEEPNPTGDSRFDFYLPISDPPATEPIEFMVPVTERFGMQVAKGNKGQDHPRCAIADPPPNHIEKNVHARPLAQVIDVHDCS